MKTLIISCFLLSVVSTFAQIHFRNGIFLHHSTGQYTWGPNPDENSTTTIPEQMHLYNISHGFTGNDSISMNEEWWSPGDNEWSTQHAFFEENTSYTDINSYLSSNKIIVIKSCFPSSSIDSYGQASDTLDPTYKSVWNYKWHWRHIINKMKNHPNNFFAIWTNAPLEISSTTLQEAALAKSFCKWAKDTLAQGLDPITGAFPPNIYVFDFFKKLTGSNGIMLNLYRTDQYDSHPNGAATNLIAPQFVNEIFNAALAYESILSSNPEIISKKQIEIFPNPASNKIIINIPENSGFIIVTVFDELGRCLKQKQTNNEQSVFDISDLKKGLYFLNIKGEKNNITKQLMKN